MERRESLYIEELYEKAYAFIDERNYIEAKALIEEILEIDATYGRAYNVLGWIYNETLHNRIEAERMYKLAIKYARDYGATYINYLYVLLDMNRLADAKTIIAKAKKVTDVNKSTLSYLEGRVFELEGHYKKAFAYYTQAYKLSLNTGFMEHMTAEKDRVRKKMGRVRSAIAALTW